MLVRAPLVQAKQHGSIRIQDLTKVAMARRLLRLAEERLVPFEAGRNVIYADDRPCAFHRISAVGLTLHGTPAPIPVTGSSGTPVPRHETARVTAIFPGELDVLEGERRLSSSVKRYTALIECLPASSIEEARGFPSSSIKPAVYRPSAPPSAAPQHPAPASNRSS